MTHVPSRRLLTGSQAQSVAAFNVITMEHAQGIVAGAAHIGAPVILQLSQNAIRYHGSASAIAAAMVAVAREAQSPVSLHLDHITDLDLLHLAPELGFDSVMYDGAALPFDENLATTKEAAAWAHEHGLWIEAELGEVGGKDGAHAPGVRTDPHEAHDFVRTTGVDALAVAVGSSHAMLERTAAVDLGLIERLRDAVPVPLVLHGSSGVPDDQLRAAAQAGMRKINIGTALNIAFSGAVRAKLVADEALVDPRKYLSVGRAAVADAVAHFSTLVSGPAPEEGRAG